MERDDHSTDTMLDSPTSHFVEELTRWILSMKEKFNEGRVDIANRQCDDLLHALKRLTTDIHNNELEFTLCDFEEVDSTISSNSSTAGDDQTTQRSGDRPWIVCGDPSKCLIWIGVKFFLS